MQLYIGNLAPEVDEPLLYELISQLAPLRSVRLPKHKIKQTHQGYGFAVFNSEADARYVLDLVSSTPIKLYGRTLRASTAQHSTNKDASSSLAAVATNQSQGHFPRVFVGNLDPQIADERSVALPFEKFGKVASVQLIKQPEQPKCHAFVKMNSFEAAETAIKQLNNQIILNRSVKVEFER